MDVPRRMRVLLAVVAVASVSLLLFQLVPHLSDVSGVAEARLLSAEQVLQSYTYRPCGEYEIQEGVYEKTFQFTASGSLYCYIIIRMPPQVFRFRPTFDQYYLGLSWVDIVVRPPSREFRYYVSAKAYRSSTLAAGVLGPNILDPRAELDAKAGEDILRRHFGRDQPADHHILFFSYIPIDQSDKPVEVFVKVVTVLHTGPPISREETLRIPSPEDALARRLGISDIHAFMRYLGYELCGEYTLEHMKNLTIRMDFSSKVGKACYIILRRPSPDVIVRGDFELIVNLSAAPPELRAINWTHFSETAVDLLGLSRGSSDLTVNPPLAFQGRFYLPSRVFTMISQISMVSPEQDSFLIVFSLRNPNELPDVDVPVMIEILVRPIFIPRSSAR